MNINKVLRLLVVIVLIAPIVLQYIFRWSIYNISVYGIYLICYMCIQFVFAYQNNKKNNNNNQVKEIKKDFVEKQLGENDENGESDKINVMVVGHQEDPEYFRQCLESIKVAYFNLKLINKVYVIIDGDSDQDNYMIKIFFEVFSGCRSVHFNKIKELFEYVDYIKNNDIICVSQVHNGKREAMMTGFSLSILEDIKVKAIFCTDSDTVVFPDTIETLYNELKSNDNAGAVAGNLAIYNKYDSIVSFVSSVRYWYAFNLERAYQSFNKSVLCVSGPLGIYRLSSLELVIKEWSDQEFLGNKCTYGDDRHLTNKILGLGQDVIYIESAYAETETPTGVYRFYKQQTRWSKSAFREFWWSVGILDKHSIFMTIDLVYTLVYPYIVMGYLMYVLWFGDLFKLGLYLSIVFVLGVIKSVYGYIRSKNAENLFYGTYTLLYVCVVFPGKIWALININDNSWGTSTRKIMNNDISNDIVVPIIWNVVLLTGLVINITHINEYKGILYVFVPGIVWLIYFIVLIIYVTSKKKQMGKDKVV